MGKHLKIEDLTKSNVWTLTEAELSIMLHEGKGRDGFAENETHYMNIIRPVFDVKFIDSSNIDQVQELVSQHFEIFSFSSVTDNNSIAIRKHKVQKITDLTMENIAHLLPEEILSLIENNMGTGWQGLPLSIQDIIQTAFYVDSAVLPSAVMHRKGGMIDRRRSDGYIVLEISRGSWVEAIFLKSKPVVEKVRSFNSRAILAAADKASEEEDIDDEELDSEEDVEDNERIDDDDEEMSMDDESQNPEEIEDIDVIDDGSLDDEEE